MFSSILGISVGVVMIVGMILFVWESTVMLEERKKRYRAGTHDYYDNPIKKDNDETIS